MNCNQPDSNEATEIFSQPSALKDRAFIEIPCPTSWENMTGDDTVRFCGQCSLNVYNISSMTDKEAEAVFAKGKNGERLCARLYRRPDGTVMTDNCPRALRKIRNGSRWLKTKIVACFGLLLSLISPAQAEGTDKADSKNGATSKCTPIKDKNKDKDSKNNGSKDKAIDKSVKDSNPPAHTMGAIRVPTPAEKAELGKVAAPSAVAPIKVEPHKVDPQKVEQNATKFEDKPGGAPILHKMGRVRVGPAVDPSIPAKEKAK